MKDCLVWISTLIPSATDAARGTGTPTLARRATNRFQTEPVSRCIPSLARSRFSATIHPITNPFLSQLCVSPDAVACGVSEFVERDVGLGLPSFLAAQLQQLAGWARIRIEVAVPGEAILAKQRGGLGLTPVIFFPRTIEDHALHPALGQFEPGHFVFGALHGSH